MADDLSVRPFANPSWFGAVMASSILASVVGLEAEITGWSWLTSVASAILVVATVLSVLLAFPYARRMAHVAELTQEIGDPTHGPMLATVPAGVLLLAGAWGSVGGRIVGHDAAEVICAALLLIGAVGAVAFSVTWSTSPLRGSKGLGGITGAWLIPPMSLALVSVPIAPLVQSWPRFAVPLMAIAVMFLGAGILLSLVMFTLLLARLILHPVLPSSLAPTMWIPLAPAGVVGIAALHLAAAANERGIAGPIAKELGLTAAAVGLGFGLWWIGYATWDLRRLRKSGPIGFQPSWFAFLFPPSALALSFLLMEQQLALAAFVPVTVVVVAGLFGLWLWVLIRSVPLLPEALR